MGKDHIIIIIFYWNWSTRKPTKTIEKQIELFNLICIFKYTAICNFFFYNFLVVFTLSTWQCVGTKTNNSWVGIDHFPKRCKSNGFRMIYGTSSGLRFFQRSLYSNCYKLTYLPETHYPEECVKVYVYKTHSAGTHLQEMTNNLCWKVISE